LKRNSFYLYPIFILVLSSLACSIFGLQESQSDILFSDDFSTTGNKWDQVSDNAGSTDYYNDAYRIVVNTNNYYAWANPGNESFIDTHIEVDATKNGGPDDNDFGLICRYIDKSQFYFALISSDGYYGILKMTPDGIKIIGKDNLLESDLITQNAIPYRIRFDCIGSTLTLYVNDALLDQQTDIDYTAGNVGLLAGSFATAGTDILFDNFVVYKP
jgi:hypothetical protein